MRILNSGALIGTVRRSCQPLMFNYIDGFIKKKAIFNGSIVNNFIRRGAGIISTSTSKNGLIFIGGLIPPWRTKKLKRLKKNLVYFAKMPGGQMTNIKRHSFFFRRMRRKKKNKLVPDAVVTLDQSSTKTHTISVAQQLRIPAISVINSDLSPNRASYPIPSSNNTIANRTSCAIYFLTATLKGRVLGAIHKSQHMYSKLNMHERKKKWKALLKKIHTEKKGVKFLKVKVKRKLRKKLKKNDKTRFK